jgi:hypothetical protein
MADRPAAGGGATGKPSAGKSKGNGGKQKDSSASDQNAPSPSDKVSTASAALYKGWMTGWSYEACRNLYFSGKNPKSYSSEVKEDLLLWLSTYLNLVSGWSPVAVDSISADLEQMTADVTSAGAGTPSPLPGGQGEKVAQEGTSLASLAAKLTDIVSSLSSIAGTPSPAGTQTAPAIPAPITVATFDADFEGVAGAVRAQAPYAYDAVCFGQRCSRLVHPRSEDANKTEDTITELTNRLTQMRSFLPVGAYDVIRSDLDACKGWGNPSNDKKTKALKEDIQIWSELMFGTATPKDLLKWRGSAILYFSLAMVAVVLFTLISGIVFGVGMLYYSFTSLAGIHLSNLGSYTKDFVTDVAALLGGLNTLGLTISLLSSKAWSGLKEFETWAAVHLAMKHEYRIPVELS